MDQARPQPTVKVVTKQDRFTQKVAMLCVVWWNFEPIIIHSEFVQNGAANAALYSESHLPAFQDIDISDVFFELL